MNKAIQIVIWLSKTGNKENKQETKLSTINNSGFGLNIFHEVFFFIVCPPKESIFLTTIHGLYFSHQFNTLHYNLQFFHAGPLAFVYCINACLSNLWVKDMCTIPMQTMIPCGYMIPANSFIHVQLVRRLAQWWYSNSN